MWDLSRGDKLFSHNFLFPRASNRMGICIALQLLKRRYVCLRILWPHQDCHTDRIISLGCNVCLIYFHSVELAGCFRIPPLHRTAFKQNNASLFSISLCSRLAKDRIRDQWRHGGCAMTGATPRKLNASRSRFHRSRPGIVS